ncbi:hypothetical protein HanRHA438_Chr09g0383211 [Helianthus annuus]|nr:hypothetical protein HanHA300_Chr09g0305181 [Helianthus annuus]KAJ0541196.1 hypothetical protein HanHA89_Chr09g0325671 [Helianthus annuus]KAJ0706278.1 hypothetical protein HanLR1_Chr09g0305171 [Helianthus annuus]KAJ0886768.1 hypothetical protein HanRHA438_Chr09g0383211 [Helianthus annuus]
MENKLGFFGVIKESFNTATRIRKLFVIFLLIFLSYSLLDFLQEYELAPFTEYFMWQLANHQNIVHDLLYNFDQTSYAVDTLDAFRVIVLVKLLVIETFSIITLYYMALMVCCSYIVYTAKLSGPFKVYTTKVTTKVLSRKDIFYIFCKSLMRSIITSFYLSLLSCGIIFFYAIVIGIIAFLAVNSWALLFLGVIALSIPVCYIYVATVWMVSLIVSVLEEGSSGLKAIGRALELMKGKRLEATLMMVLFALANGFVVLVAKLLASYGWNLSAKLAITILFTNGFCWLLKLFMFVVYTVFYHEWKTSHDEKEGKGFNLPIANVKA